MDVVFDGARDNVVGLEGRSRGAAQPGPKTHHGAYAYLPRILNKGRGVAREARGLPDGVGDAAGGAPRAREAQPARLRVELARHARGA